MQGESLYMYTPIKMYILNLLYLSELDRHIGWFGKNFIIDKKCREVYI